MLVEDFIQKTNLYKKKYGENTILLMQVGAFFEVYGIKYMDKLVGSDLTKFTNLCDLSIANKHCKASLKDIIGKSVKGDVYMAGFRDYMLDKYIKRLQDNNYTVVIYEQEPDVPTIRKRTGIYSPGTYFDKESQEISNNILCIWIIVYKNKMIFGLSNLNIFTGTLNIFEHESSFTKYSNNLDEIERFVSIYMPRQTLIIYNCEENVVNNVIKQVQLSDSCVSRIDINNPALNKEKVINCQKQTYQVTILKKYFPKWDSDYRNMSCVTNSLCYLLEYVCEHNPDLVNKIKEPIYDNCSNKLLLKNHSLKQLNILGDTNGNKTSSVLKFMNKCISPMGKRLLHSKLTTPTQDIEYLEDEYNLCDYIKNTDMISSIRDLLVELKDLEKLTRKIVLKTVTPCDIIQLYYSIQILNKICEILFKDKVLFTYLEKNEYSDIISDLEEVSSFIDKYFDMEMSESITKLPIDNNIIKNGIDKNYDEQVDCWEKSQILFNEVRLYLNDKIAISEKKYKTDYVKKYQTEKSGISLISTKRRIELLKKNIDKKKTLNDSTFDFTKLTFNKSTASNWTINSHEIDKVCSEVTDSKDRMIFEVNRVYNEWLDKCLDYIPLLDKISGLAGLIDFIFCKAWLANKYNYTRPVIKEKESSYLDIKGLRHCLIEHLLQDELYVDNDISFNSSQLGILLYGTNAVGKSSFIKSIGITVILAQAGFFVPCKEMTYSPYEHIFTRILGNDDLFKGLSTFAVEMSELNNILNVATNKSLILGDELCSGTETSSAISIFVAGIEDLYNKSSNFIFATHFHEIVNYDEITEKSKLTLKHMAVSYNYANDTLVYNRKLADGPGKSMYGLEVCKALHLPDKFLTRAHELRNKYEPDNNIILDQKQSRYNSKKILGLCEKCKIKKAEDTHHLQSQSNADANGYIDSFHKNHAGNLMALCKDCHKNIHKETSKGHVRRKALDGTIILEEV